MTDKVRLSPKTKGVIEKRQLNRETERGCFLCTRILEALGPYGELRDWPVGGDNVEFPISGQRKHVLLEVQSCET